MKPSAGAVTIPPITARTLTDRAVGCLRNRLEHVLRPAPVDELLDLRRHLDLRGPFPGALERSLGRRVDADLAADELQRRGMVEMVERALADQHVPLRI